jgi:hypothetical protein
LPIPAPHHTGKSGNALIEFAIDAAQLIPPLKLPCHEAEPGQDEREQQTVPELQAPANGLEEFHSMQ